MLFGKKGRPQADWKIDGARRWELSALLSVDREPAPPPVALSLSYAFSPLDHTCPLVFLPGDERQGGFWFFAFLIHGLYS